MTEWNHIKSRWSSSWAELQKRASSAYAAAIRANPGQFEGKVAAFVQLLQESRGSLDRIKAHLAMLGDDTSVARESATALESRYATLAAGVYADAQTAENIGVAPLVVGGVVVAGVLVSVGGIAWAVAAYQYAVNLREHTALLEKELAARVEASRTGRSLSPSSIPPAPDPVGQASNIGLLLLGGLALAAAVIAAPILMKRVT